MQQLDAGKSPPHEGGLLFSPLCEQSREAGATAPVKVNTHPDVTFPKLLQSRTRSRRRRRKRVWRAAWTYLLQGASFLAHVRLAAVDDADDKGDYDGNCCQTSY